MRNQVTLEREGQKLKGSFNKIKLVRKKGKDKKGRQKKKKETQL